MSATATPAQDRSDFRTVTLGGALVGLVTGVAVVLVVAASRTRAGDAVRGGVEGRPRSAAARCRPSPARSSWRRSPGWLASPSRSPPPPAGRSLSSSRRSPSSPSPARDSGWDGRRAPLARPSAGRRGVARDAGPGLGRVLRGTVGRRPGGDALHQSPDHARGGRCRGRRVRLHDPRHLGPLHAPCAAPPLAPYGSAYVGGAARS